MCENSFDVFLHNGVQFCSINVFNLKTLTNNTILLHVHYFYIILLFALVFHFFCDFVSLVFTIFLYTSRKLSDSIWMPFDQIGMG